MKLRKHRRKSKGRSTEEVPEEIAKVDLEELTRQTTRKLTEYWTNILQSSKEEPRRRDRAAKELAKIANAFNRVAAKNKKESRPVLRERSLDPTAPRVRRKGKKEARREKAEEAAQDNEWAGLIPKAKVLDLDEARSKKRA